MGTGKVALGGPYYYHDSENAVHNIDTGEWTHREDWTQLPARIHTKAEKCEEERTFKKMKEQLKQEGGSKTFDNGVTMNYPPPENALQRQVGGEHYKKLPIQPMVYCHKNNLGACESAVVQYVSRWKDKGGVEDLKKAIHILEMLIEMEKEND